MDDSSGPKLIISQLDILSGQDIADLGTGAGAYALALAEKLLGNGNNSRVFAIDVQKNLLEKIQTEAEIKGFYNLKTIWGDIEAHEGTRLRDNSIDWVFLANTLFQAEDKNALLREALRIVRPGGKFILVDWSSGLGQGAIGPSSVQVIPENEAKTICENIGFEFVKNLSAGEHHYCLVFKKN